MGIEVGDKVLVKYVVFPHKSTSNFDATQYVVVKKNGNEVTLTGGSKTLRSNVSHVKKIPLAKQHLTYDSRKASKISFTLPNEQDPAVQSLPSSDPNAGQADVLITTTVYSRTSYKDIYVPILFSTFCNINNKRCSRT